MSAAYFKRFPLALATCIFVALLCANSRAALIAHYDLNFNQPLRFEVFPNATRFTWNLIGLAPTTLNIPVGWDTTSPGDSNPGYRLGDVVTLPALSPQDQLTSVPNPITHHFDSVSNLLTVQWSCENCYLTYSVLNPPMFAIPAGSLVASGTATITAVNDYQNKPPNTVMWGLAVDLYGTQSVPEPGGVLVLLGVPLVWVRGRTK